MSQRTASGIPNPHVEARRERVRGALQRPLVPVASTGTPLSEEGLRYLVREAEELYWNELAWEELTEEERVAGGHLTELVFPGFLAFVDGLLLDPGAARGQSSGARPEVVEQILLFLAERYTRATDDLGRGADSENLVWARAMTAHLIDLVLYRLYGLDPEEREELESRG